MRSATVRAASRRGWVCPISAAHAAAEFEADLRDLRRLAGSGLAGDDDDLVLGDRGGDVVAARADRQGGRILDRGDRRLPCRDPDSGFVDLARDRGEGLR